MSEVTPGKTAPLRHGLARLQHWIAGEPVLAILLCAFAALEALRPLGPVALFKLVDWQTVLTLAGLLMLTKAIEYSGALDAFARALLRYIHTERALACLLVLLAAGLATLLTNDVALFAIVPLTLSLHKLTPLPIKRLVIVIALAVNAGSVLTPLGNPQNLFLWQQSGVSFLAFTWALAPLAGALMAALLLLSCLLFRARGFSLPQQQKPAAALVVLHNKVANTAHPHTRLSQIGKPLKTLNKVANTPEKHHSFNGLRTIKLPIRFVTSRTTQTISSR